MQVTFKGKTYDTAADLTEDQDLVVKVNGTREGDTEGFWMAVDPKDLADYQANKVDDTYCRIGVALNTTLMGIIWGTYFPYRLNGDGRPAFIFEDCIDSAVDKIIFSPGAPLSIQKSFLEGQDMPLNMVHKALSSGIEGITDEAKAKWAADMAKALKESGTDNVPEDILKDVTAWAAEKPAAPQEN